MRAGFAETDITPPIGTHKIGWLKDLVSESVHDPLSARIAVFGDGPDAIGFIQLDTLSVRWSQVQDIRSQIVARYGFPGESVLVSATHNHAGPAVASAGLVKRDGAYAATLTAKCVEAFGTALANHAEAEIGHSGVFEFRVGFNRRVIMRDGTVQTHGSFRFPDALCLEGPVDPEVSVVAARGKDGALLGCIVNFTCHPTDYGDGPILSAGYPGVLAAEMKRHGWPVTLFLNGASGNISRTNPVVGSRIPMEEAGQILAEDALSAIGAMQFGDDWAVRATRTTVQLPYRDATPEQQAGTVRGAQRFVDPAIYDELMPALKARIAERGSQPAEVQALFLGNLAFVGIPAEYFVEHQLRIKQETYPTHALVVGHANGMVGYVPTAAAFKRGGYETTFAPSSRLAPEAGDLLADAAIRLVREHLGARFAGNRTSNTEH